MNVTGSGNKGKNKVRNKTIIGLKYIYTKKFI